MARNVSNRMSTLFSFGVPKSSNERSKSPSRRSGNASPVAHSRAQSRQELRATKSSHNLSSESSDLNDDRRAHQPSLSNLMTDVQPGLITGLGDEILMPPPSISGFGDRTSSPSNSRPGSRGRPQTAGGSTPGSRAGSPGGDWLRTATPASGKLSKRKSWLPGSKAHSEQEPNTLKKTHDRNASDSIPMPDHMGPHGIFVASPQGRTPYNSTPLVEGLPVPELWDDSPGNMYIHLSDKASGRYPSFRVHPSIISSSKQLTGQGQGIEETVEKLRSHMRTASLATPGSQPGSEPGSQAMSRSSSGGLSFSESEPVESMLEEEADGLHLYIHLTNISTEHGAVSTEGIDSLVRIRNLFAFLVGQILVGTALQPTLFFIFKSIAGMLRGYEFTNMDGSTLGEGPSASFLGYVQDLKLADIRFSREKTMEALVLGERMKCWPLYNEAYVHGVGKWSDMLSLRTNLWNHISDTTRNRMEISSMALKTRLNLSGTRLEDLEFPSLFAGVLASSAARKAIDPASWRNAFQGMRKHALLIYQARYGSWPPKAKSKRNDFEANGLNRVVVQEMYQDFSDLYDMLVDRKSLTTRSIDITADETLDEAVTDNPSVQYLRKFMSEFDRSSPPVLPPIPYDLPQLPNLADVRRDFTSLTLRKQVKERSKTVKDNDINMALMATYNQDSIKVTPFVESFMAFERASARGKTFDEIVDLRIGQWIFLYVIMQSLPMLAIDAPGVQNTQGVEYFLCEVPKGFPPWLSEDGLPKKALYRIAGSQGVVSLPADVVDHGVEGTYFRSHCWQMATRWNEAPATTNLQSSASGRSQYSAAASAAYSEDLPPPPVLGGGGFGSRGSSPSGSRPSSVALGLEALPMPPSIGAASEKASRRVSTPNPQYTFDAIIGEAGSQGKKKKK